jgi:DNA-binding IclR family transcriptional regulator
MGFIPRTPPLVKQLFSIWTGILDRGAVPHYPWAVSAVADKTLGGRSDNGAAGRSTSTGVHATLIVLDTLAAASGPMQLSELARELTVPKSTIHRICAVLVERGWAVRDAAGAYALGIRALRLGSRSNDLPIVSAFRTVAAEYLTRHDEMLALAVLDGEESLYIAIEETSQPVRLVTHVGSKTPAFASASGRVILAALPPAQIDALFAGQPLVTPTGRRLNGVPELQIFLAEVRERGYAENMEETAIGLYAASVPVTNAAGMTLAALTTCIPTSRMTEERRDAMLDDLRAEGRTLSELVEWLPAFNARRP